MIRLMAIALMVTAARLAAAQQARDPRPVPAIQAILDAFDRVPVVALGMSHRLQDETDFSLALVRDPWFARTVNDVVVECGNPLYQADMDRYVRGASIPIERLQRFWRNTTQPGACDPQQHRELVDAIRNVNRHQSGDRWIRILAGDPPAD